MRKMQSGRTARVDDGHDTKTMLPRLARGLLGDRAGPRIRLLRNLLTQRITDALAPFGLRLGALTTMSLIAANPGCSQMALAREMDVEKSAVAAIVDELERNGLIARMRAADDRRRNELALTKKGQRVMGAMHAAATAEETGMEAAFSPAEFALFLTFLDRAYEALQSEP